MTDATAIQAELEQAVTTRQELASLRRRARAAATQLAELEQRVYAARQKLQDEAADVERLESFSASKIWAQLKGSHATDLERETAEREAARYAVAEAEAQRDAMQRDHAALESRIAELGDAEGRYRRALAEKEAWLSAADAEAARQLAEIAERRGELIALDREVREAQLAGRRARDLLSQAAPLLVGAGSGSTWNSVGGGALVTDLIRNEKVDRATEILRQADLALAAFSRELADVDLPQVHGGVQFGQSTRTLDLWMNNIFSDMAVRSRMEEARRRVDDALRQVEQALAALDQKAHSLNRELDELSAQREQLLLG